MRGFLLLAVLLTSQVGVAEQPVGGAFETDDGALRGILPCRPSRFQEAAPLPSMPPVRGYKCSGPSFMAAVQYLDYPPTDVDPKVILDHARDGSVANVKDGRLVSEERGRLAGRPGTDIVVAGRGVTLRERMVIDRDKSKTRLYIIEYGTVPSDATNPRMQAFFDSIRFKTDLSGSPAGPPARQPR
jgi:hypothetical protein